MIGVVRELHSGAEFFGTISTLTDAQRVEHGIHNTDVVIVGYPWNIPNLGQNRIFPIVGTSVQFVDVCPDSVPLDNRFP